MKARLNQRTIDCAKYQGPGGCYIWDTVTRGFGLRIYPSGRKSFVITYSAKGRQRFYTLGCVGEMMFATSSDRGPGYSGSGEKG